jgi:hypothetical protein
VPNPLILLGRLKNSRNCASAGTDTILTRVLSMLDTREGNIQNSRSFNIQNFGSQGLKLIHSYDLPEDLFGDGETKPTRPQKKKPLANGNSKKRPATDVCSFPTSTKKLITVGHCIPSFRNQTATGTCNADFI